MTEINPYIDNQFSYINTLMKQPLAGFTNPKGDMATWDDAALKFSFHSTKSINYYFVYTSIKTRLRFKEFDDSQKLPKKLRHLLIAYAIYLTANKNTLLDKGHKHSVARQFLSLLNCNPANATDSQIDNAVCKMPPSNIRQLILFFNWLKEKYFIPNNLMFNNSYIHKNLAGEDIIEHKKNKRPESKILLALGSIFHDVISPDRHDWDLHPLASQRDAFVCTMVALGMSSPNRIAAEQTVLVKQKLKNITQNINGKKEKVHYLAWQGSKGYQNYHNHILSIMAGPVERCLEYISEACQPARVLARFYEDPSLPLKTVLGDFYPPSKNLEALNPNFHKPTNLIHLGYLLGYYEKGDGMMRVTQKTAGSVITEKSNKGGTKIFIKRIVDIQSKDELVLIQGCHYAKYLIGTTITGKLLNSIFGGHIVTLSQFQERWIQHIKNNIKGFPVGYNKTKNGKCLFKHALFAFTGSQLGTSYLAGSSPFALMPLSSLGDSLRRQLHPSGRDQYSIFYRHGFSNEFHINPHQFRHWCNDVAEREGIPHAIINLWSGRKSPEQILHYVYRTHAEKASEIADIFFNEAGQELSLKVISQLEYDKLSQSATTLTSVGFCSQKLEQTPCTWLNNFMTQCTLCPSSCHVAHDEESLSLLKKDLQFQKCRLEDIQKRPTFCTSEGNQNWFLVHHRNTEMLSKLVQLMENKEIKKGAVIRLLSHMNQFRITDVAKQLVTTQKLILPDSDKALAKALEPKKGKSTKDNTNYLLTDLFSTF
ncbi:MAG: hypothetical protein ACJAT7_002306 [Psychromonas sp.]|jgi:hypothetical protein|uniref:hypothetical protein n=1 Tax=Psychromonas sp. TaxID=1884585 RepID=UPI0039E61FD4